MKYKNLLAFFLLLLVFSLSGCIMGDNLYYTATEQYQIGWLLHNINSSTPTNLTFSLSELSVYNYSFNYPAYQPNEYINYIWWIAPCHNDSLCWATQTGNMIAVPLNRTYYLLGNNSVPEYYQTNWSFSNYVIINYSYEYEEHYKSEDAFHAITPIPGEKKTIYFGTPPYQPTSLNVSQNLTLKDYLLRAYNKTSYILTNTWLLPEDIRPRYEIYLNGTLKLIGTFENWNYSLLDYPLSETGNYSVILTLVSTYPVFNLTRMEANFGFPSPDFQPPSLERLEARPYFEYNKLYSVKFNASDNVSISHISVFYTEEVESSNPEWVELNLSFSSGSYNTSINVTNRSTNKIGLKICINDTQNNQINYTFLPISITPINLSITINCPSSKIPLGNIVDYTLESPHPYPNRYNYTWKINYTGFENIAIHFVNISVESGFDFIRVYDGQNNTIAEYTGSLTDTWTPSANGDTLYVSLSSDYAINYYGFYVDKILNGSFKCEAVKGGNLIVEGLVYDDKSKFIDGLKLDFFFNQTFLNSSMTKKGKYSSLLEFSCGDYGDTNFSVVFPGTGVYPPKSEKKDVNLVSLNFSINETGYIDKIILINASSSGGILTINRSDLGWNYSVLMEKKLFYFIPRNYGNYTINLSTKCENKTVALFVNVTNESSITGFQYYPYYPLPNENITAYVYTFSQTPHSLTFNLSNSTYSNSYDLNSSSSLFHDSITREPYNYSYVTWSGKITNLEKGKYDVNITLEDAIGNVKKKSYKIFVYPFMNITFNLTEYNGKPINRTVYIGFDSYSNIENRIFEINGSKGITLQNLSYFYPEKNVSSHVWISNFLNNTYQSIIFLNSSLEKTMNLISEYYLGMKFFDEYIGYLIYSFRPSWNYSSSMFVGSVNATSLGLLRNENKKVSGITNGYNYLCMNVTLPQSSDINISATFKSINDNYARNFMVSLDCFETENKRWIIEYGCNWNCSSPFGRGCNLGCCYDGTYNYTFYNIGSGEHRICVWPSSILGYDWATNLSIQFKFSNMSLYSCSEWDFVSKKCNSKWNPVENLSKYSYGDFVYFAGESNTEAFAIGELQYCGDGFCNSKIGESCSSCAQDCGVCPTTQNQTNQTQNQTLSCLPIGSNCSSNEDCCSNYCYNGVCQRINRSVEITKCLDYLRAKPGENISTSLKVKNVGNIELENLKLEVEAPDFLKINTSSIESLKINETAQFYVNISLPQDAKEGNYSLNSLVKYGLENMGNCSSSIEIFVEKVNLSVYIELLNNLEKEVNELKNKGLNVSEIKEKIEKAKSICEAGDYENCKKMVEEIDEFVSTAREEKATNWLWIILIGSGALAASLFIGIKYIKPRKVLTPFEELTEKSLEKEISELENKIKAAEWRMLDFKECEKELENAKFALSNNLFSTAELHLKNAKQKFEELIKKE